MKKNKLTTAVVAGIAGVAGMAGVSNAMHLNDKGVGEVLIYPYYTVANGLNTLLSVVNTTENVKAVKVRFLEGDNSMEVLDFNIYMSPYDVWTAALGSTTSTFSGHSNEPSGYMISSDQTCATGIPAGTAVEFRPQVIDGDLASANMSMERATHGHFEMLDMGIVDAGSAFAAAATHVAGVPASCATIDAAWSSGGTWITAPNTSMTYEFGGLFGGASLVDVAEGFAVSYEAIAIQDFWAAGATAAHTNPGDLLPGLGNGDQLGVVYLDGMALSTNWNNGYEAVSSLFMQDQVYNEYYVDADAQAKTDWVVTFPTKRFHTNGGVVAPFTAQWDGVEACEDYAFSIWDREEGTPAGTGVLISPVSPGSTPEICQEVNVVQFLQAGSTASSASEILGDTNLVTVGNAFSSGWGRMSFAQSMSAPLTGEPGYNGLPVAGFAVQKATNAAAAPGVLAQYGVLFDHRGRVVSN